MAGLVVLGLLTVVAGVLSGRSTINYVLARDAREAALSWAAEIDKRLGEQAFPPPRLLDKDLQVLDAAKLNADVASPSGAGASLPTNSTFNTDGFSLIEGLDRLTMGWALSHIYRTHNEFVSKLDGFAVLAPDGATLAVGGNLSPASLQTMLGESGGGAALAQSVNDNAVGTVAIPGDAHNRLAFVPMTDDGKVARVYAFAVDQTAAAALTNVALTVVTLTKSCSSSWASRCPRPSPRGASASAGSPRIRFVISPCTTRSPACRTACGSTSISTARSPAASATAT